MPMDAAATERNVVPRLEVQPMAVPVGVPQSLPYVARAQPVRRMTQRGAPVEPHRVALRVVLIIFGALLLGFFCLPISMRPMSFSWDYLLAAPTTYAMVSTLWLVVGGAIAVIVALIPMPTLVRAVIALGIGVGALAVKFGLGPTPEWQAVASTTGMLCMIVGLLLRHHYTESIGARLATSVGALTVLAVYLVPAHGTVPLLAAIEALGSNHTVEAVLVIAPALVALVSLLVWLGANTSAGLHGAKIQ